MKLSQIESFKVTSHPQHSRIKHIELCPDSVHNFLKR